MKKLRESIRNTTHTWMFIRMNQWKKHGHQNVRVKELNTLEDALVTSGRSENSPRKHRQESIKQRHKIEKIEICIKN